MRTTSPALPVENRTRVVLIDAPPGLSAGVAAVVVAATGSSWLVVHLSVARAGPRPGRRGVACAWRSSPNVMGAGGGSTGCSWPGSPSGVTAVDGQGDADDEARAGAAQPQHRGGDLVGFAEAVDRLV